MTDHTTLIARLEILGSGSADEDDKTTMLEAATAIAALEKQIEDHECDPWSPMSGSER